MTTDNLIEELTRLEKEATPGPWEGRGYGHISAHVPQSYEAEGFTITTSRTPLLRLPEGVAAGNWKNDADLIVSLRNHLPAILSALKENKRLREALTELLIPVKFAGETMWGPPDDRFPGYEARVPSEFVRKAEAALQPQGEK